MELDWNTPANTRAWVDGYASAYQGTAWLYNYGDCGRCRSDGVILPVPGSGANSGWTQEDVWYISWGAGPAWAIPEIYNTLGTNARQWQNIVLYSRVNHGSPMGIKGTLTQWQACQDRPPCAGTNNTPDQGWSQLWNALNADPRTAQDVPWSTDITWQN
jgi:hypothetical protein